MNTPNQRKQFIIFSIAVGFGALTLIYQNFTKFDSPLKIEKSNTSMESALSAALQNAEVDHKEKQMALNVEPGQIEKASFKRGQKSKTIEDKPEFVDIDVEKSMSEEVEVEDAMISDKKPE